MLALIQIKQHYCELPERGRYARFWETLQNRLAVLADRATQRAIRESQ